MLWTLQHFTLAVLNAVHPAFALSCLVQSTSTITRTRPLPDWCIPNLPKVITTKTLLWAFFAAFLDFTGNFLMLWVYLQATVGAGLPVIATLKHLVDTGDRILKVEGIFSGTLSYIFNMFSQDKPFSDIVTEAKALGYTEPDPRDDLAGMDVARKVTILAR